MNRSKNTTPRKALTANPNQRRIDLVVGNKQEQMMTTEFKIDGLEEYLDHIRMNYIQWVKPEDDDSWKQQRCIEFCMGLSIEYGTKFAKIITTSGGSRSVHSFVCLNDMGKFTKGDILKAAGWNAPAKNFARGNTMARDFGQVAWTGA